MINARLLETIEWSVLIAAFAMCFVAALLWQSPYAIGSTAAGGLLAVVNLLVLRRTVAGFIGAGAGKQAVLSVILFLKMGLLVGAIWGAVSVLGLHPLGVGLGASALLLGIVGGSLTAPRLHADESIGSANETP